MENTMTVADLIKLLKTYPQDAIIMIDESEYGWNYFTEENILDDKIMKKNPTLPPKNIIGFSPY